MNKNKNLALDVLTNVLGEEHTSLSQIIKECYQIQEKYQYDTDRTDAMREMEKIIDTHLQSMNGEGEVEN